MGSTKTPDAIPMTPKAEPEPTPERPASEPRPEKEPPMGEPGPDWELVGTNRGWFTAWDCHWIGMVVLFGLLTVFALYCLHRLFKRKRKEQTMAKFSVTVTAVIALFTSTRCLYLLINPYESPVNCLFGEENCPIFINRFLFSLGIPSLLSAYMLLFLALNDVVQMKVIGRFNKLQSWQFLTVFVTVNYVFSCTADLTVTYVTSASLFLALCQGYFILFSTFLVIAFLYVGIKLYLTDKATKSQIARLSMRHRNDIGHQSGRRSVKKVVRFAIVTAIIGGCLLALEIFALAFVYVSTFSHGSIEPWAWLAYQYIYRLVELIFAGSILYNISFLPQKKAQATGRSAPYSTLRHGKVEIYSSVKGEASTSAFHIGDSSLQGKANENELDLQLGRPQMISQEGEHTS